MFYENVAELRTGTSTKFLIHDGTASQVEPDPLRWLCLNRAATAFSSRRHGAASPLGEQNSDVTELTAVLTARLKATQGQASASKLHPRRPGERVPAGPAKTLALRCVWRTKTRSPASALWAPGRPGILWSASRASLGRVSWTHARPAYQSREWTSQHHDQAGIERK